MTEPVSEQAAMSPDPLAMAQRSVSQIVDRVARSYAMTLFVSTAVAAVSGWAALHYSKFGVVLALSTAFLGFLVSMGVMRGAVVRPLLARACKDISAVLESASVEVAPLRDALSSDDARALFDRIMVLRRGPGSSTG